MSATCYTCGTDVDSIGILPADERGPRRLCPECLNREGADLITAKPTPKIEEIRIGMSIDGHDRAVYYNEQEAFKLMADRTPIGAYLCGIRDRLK